MTLTIEVSWLSFAFARKFENRQRSGEKMCQASFYYFSFCLCSASEEKREGGAAGGCDPGLREDSHGEKQPPEGSG